jgi:hypothetical protein
MASDNLDDLFRQQLGGHATPPGPDLQRRLAELAEAERLDALFRTGLGSHASQPRREVWERLEDEHLRPQPQRRRRVVAWWQLSAAAVLLLTLLAGGLWRGGYLGQPGTGLAHAPATAPRPSGAATVKTQPSPAQPAAMTQAPSTPERVLARAETATKKKNQKNFSTQATPTAASSSSPSIATTTRVPRPATEPQAAGSHLKQRQLPDAATGQLATTGRGHGSASQSFTSSLNEQAATPTAHQSPPPITMAMTTAPEVVEVEVRRGPDPSQPATALVVAAAEPTPARRPRLRLGGLLRQADHLVHGEPLSLAEATSPSETLTVQARLGGRTVSRTIRL